MKIGAFYIFKERRREDTNICFRKNVFMRKDVIVEMIKTTYFIPLFCMKRFFLDSGLLESVQCPQIFGILYILLKEWRVL